MKEVKNVKTTNVKAVFRGKDRKSLVDVKWKETDPNANLELIDPRTKSITIKLADDEFEALMRFVQQRFYKDY